MNDSEFNKGKVPLSSVTASELTLIGISEHARSGPTIPGVLYNIDRSRVLPSNFTPAELRILMDNLDEPVFLLTRDTSEQVMQSPVSKRDVIQPGTFVLVPAKVAHLDALPVGIYYLGGNSMLNDRDREAIQMEVGGGFPVDAIQTKQMKHAFRQYMSNKRPSTMAKMMKSVGFGRRKDAAPAEEPIGPDDAVGFTREDLTPALLAHAMELYARIVPGANIELIAKGSNMQALMNDIQYARTQMFEPAFGSRFSNHSKLRLVGRRINSQGSPLYTFIFDPNYVPGNDAINTEVNLVSKAFSNSVDQLLRDWKIAQKVRD